MFHSSGKIMCCLKNIRYFVNRTRQWLINWRMKCIQNILKVVIVLIYHVDHYITWDFLYFSSGGSLALSSMETIQLLWNRQLHVVAESQGMKNPCYLYSLQKREKYWKELWTSLASICIHLSLRKLLILLHQLSPTQKTAWKCRPINLPSGKLLIPPG